jgi:uncharacterized protein YndB with AHSA1/START domain
VSRWAGTLAVTTPSDTEVVMERNFDAPRHLVFAALSRCDLLRRWLGADGWQLVECAIDLRVGGSWRFVSYDASGAAMGHAGTYTEVVPPERLAYTESYDDSWFPGEALVTHRLSERAGTTTLRTTLRFTSVEVRDAVLRSPMRGGVTHGYDRLAAVLSSLSPSAIDRE